MTDPVVLVTPTVMDGTVVRWYADVQAAERLRPALSASRNGVSVHAEYLHQVPAEWMRAANEAYAALADNRAADVEHLATHRHRLFSNGPIEPITTGGDR